MTTPSREKRVFRVSLAGLLFITLCACGFFAGYRRGYQNGGHDRQGQHYLVMYPVTDLTSPPARSGSPASISPEKLIALLQAEVAPESWETNGRGEGILSYSTKNSGLIVNQSERGHEQISMALALVRRLRLTANSPEAGEQAESLAGAAPGPPALR
jgi:hypothetical protein